MRQVIMIDNLQGNCGRTEKQKMQFQMSAGLKLQSSVGLLAFMHDLERR